jgi:cysteine-rich repeat protein
LRAAEEKQTMSWNQVLGRVLLVGLAAAVVFNCGGGGDDSNPGANNAGSSGSGGGNASGNAGSGNAGTSGSSDASAGTSGGGSGGVAQGGSAGSAVAGNGGTAGNTTGGSAGGPPATICGDGQLDPGEQCDDGTMNGTAGDVCSATCTKNACEACVQAMGGTSCAGCNALTADAGASAKTECEQILTCTRTSKCATGPLSGMFSDPTIACYCGSLDEDTCFDSFTVDPANLPSGDCVNEISQVAAPGSPPIVFGTLYFDTSGPLGAAIQRARCEAVLCPSECGLDTGAAGAGP